jgi:hypothetical protein
MSQCFSGRYEELSKDEENDEEGSSNDEKGQVKKIRETNRFCFFQENSKNCQDKAK